MEGMKQEQERIGGRKDVSVEERWRRLGSDMEEIYFRISDLKKMKLS